MAARSLVTSTAAAPSTIWLELPAGDDAVREEGGLERRELLRRGVAPRRLVDGEQDGRRRRRPRPGRSLLEPASSIAAIRAGATRASRRRAPRARGSTRSRRLGGDPLRHDLPALVQLVREVAAVRAHRDARHHLDPGRDDDVELAGPDRGGGVEVRLHRGAALAVDRRAADRLRPAGHHRRHPADVPALLADLGHAAHLDVLDLGRVEVVPRDEAVQHLRRELVAAGARERAVPPPDRAAHGVDDQRVRGHARSIDSRPWPRRPWSGSS